MKATDVAEDKETGGTVEAPQRPSRWRFAGAGAGSGLLGGVCCVGGAITTAFGLGAAGFLTTLMEGYQIYFILASVAVMVLWLASHLRRRGIAVRDFRAVGRVLGKQMLVMGVVYLATLGIALGVAQLVVT